MKIKKIIAVFASVALVLGLLSGCKPTVKPATSGIEGLVTYGTHAEIQKLITDTMKKNNQIPGFFESLVGAIRGGMQNDMAKENDAEGVLDAAPSTEDSNGSLDDYSKTNLQVEGVDEADIVKTDGRYLYIIANGRLVIVDAANPQNMKVVSEIVYIYLDQPEKNINTPVEMFLDEDNKKLTVISYSYDDRLVGIMEGLKPGAATKEGEVMEPGFAHGFYWWGMQNVLVQVFDLSDIAKPELEREFTQEGSYLSSRRINEHIYIVTNKYIYYISDLTNNDYFIPATKDSSADAKWNMVDVDAIYVVEESDFSSFLVLSSIDASDPDSTPDTKAVLGSGQNLYASPSNIYIANTQYKYDNNINTDVAEGEAAPDGDTAVSSGVKSAVDSVVEDVFRIFEPPVYTVFTDIYRFGIQDGVITLKGSGKVPGYILNQFAMDEHNGYFRIATTTGDTWREDEFTSMNNLYILDNDLKITGKVEGLATRETIRSVRFMGKMAYMVTFRTTDPLFVLDLSVPSNPQVKGELKIPGYSQYLHPITDTILVGFGREAIEEGDQAIELGIKLSVFDVSDVSNPKEISTMIIGDSGTYSEVLYNHKSLLYSKEKNILAFPITIYENTSNNNNNNRMYWNYMPTFAGYIITGLTEDYKLFEKGRISHFKPELPEDVTDEKKVWAAYERFYSMEYLYRVNRGMFIGNTLFTISNASVKANSLTDYADISTVELPGFKEINQYYFNWNYDEYPDGKDDVVEPGVDPGQSEPRQSEPGVDPGQSDSGDSSGSPDGQETLVFTGTVAEILDGGLLVKINEEFLDVGFDIATVWFAPDAKLDFKPDVGDAVKIEILPEIRESYPVQVTAIYITKAD